MTSKYWFGGAAAVAASVAAYFLWHETVGAARLARAWQYAAERRWDSVASELESYTPWHPNDLDAIELLARSYRELGNHAARAQCWERVPAGSPAKPPALLEQGAAWLAANRAQHAETSWNRCLALAETDFEHANYHAAALELARLYWLQGRTDELRSLVERWLERLFRDGDSPALLVALDWQLKSRLLEMDPVEAVERLKRFVADDQSDTVSRRGLARFAAQLGRLDVAREQLLRCLADRPNDMASWHAWVAILIETGQLAQAGELLDRMPPQAVETVPIRLLVGQWALAQGDLQRAEDSYRHVLALEPRNETALAQLTRVLRAMDRTEPLRNYVELLEATARSRARLQDSYGRFTDAPPRTPAQSRAIAELCRELGFDAGASAWERRARVLSVAGDPQPSRSPARDPRPMLHQISWADPPAPQARGDAIDSVPREPHESLPKFRDVAQAAGIDFNYFRGDTGQFWIVEPNGGGAAWIDLDQDGWWDLFFVNGCPLPPGEPAGLPVPPTSSSRLFRNRPDGTFSDATQSAALETHQYGQGCAVADFDNDGFPDLVVTNYGSIAVYHNRGDGTMHDWSHESGLNGPGFHTGCAWADLNRDGVLDLYVACYVDFQPEVHGKPCRNARTGVPEYCGPRCCPATADKLFAGRGDGTFQDVSRESGVAGVAFPGFAVIAANLDADDWPDLYVANDGQPNLLWSNQSAGDPEQRIRLRNAAMEQGCALNGDGMAQGSMGIACGDVDRDGWLDLGVSNFYHEYFTLYRNLAGRGFEDASARFQLAGRTRTSMGWGTQFFDYDNDGWLDLFVANGHINRSAGGEQPYEMRAQLFQNRRGRRLVEVGAEAGAYFRTPHVGRGAAFGDYDNDGREDVAVLHHHTPAALLHNETESENAALVLRLVGRESCRDAWNARVTVRSEASPGATANEWVREIIPGASYLSSNDHRVRVGLGKARRADVSVRWPSGKTQQWQQLAPGGTLQLTESQQGVCELP